MLMYDECSHRYELLLKRIYLLVENQQLRNQMIVLLICFSQRLSFSPEIEFPATADT